jgi:type I restriction enzyme R subunit
MSQLYKEMRFEEAIEHHLLTHGWTKGSVANFDRKLGIDTVELFAFIDATQAKAWKRLVALHGRNEDQARAAFLDRLTKEIDRRGTIHVLRRGVTDRGVAISLAFFRPAHGLTPELNEQYAANRLTITRQLPYSPRHHKTLDVALFLNGIPVATAELKNPLTSQFISNAISQYRLDRDPRELFFARRALVHFAADPFEVAMTTKLEGDKTVFLPFNRGNDGGAGNPPAEEADRYATSYLWESVWQRDAWLDILARFITKVEEIDDDGNVETKLLFPRFHQWDAVLKIVDHARDNGAGQQYLIQHSAGSGKSNTIAWAAYRLASLHDATDTKIFDKVVVVTDRIALDSQLQATIKQFEQAIGMVEAIDKDSAQLAKAIQSGSARIVVTTIQKFPVVVKSLKDMAKGRYAVIIDEAHSSQSGDTAKALKKVLGAGSVEALEAAAAEDAAAEVDLEDEIADLAARGRQPNISFLAFTATPKPKTLELFGTKGADGNYGAFHLYSMRQAIDEGFILDVLQSYTTYGTFYKVARKVADDPEIDKTKAAAAIARFVSLDEHNLEQKAEVIVEHFRAVTAKKIGGRAKAMVVTRSRLHAVRYKQAIDSYIASKGIKGLHSLVAFSGTVSADGTEYTETKMNGFTSSLPKAFKTDAYQILVVAEKYQTGFDAPLLHTMYVDKQLKGVRAVQTLSRLNRKPPNKEDTFVLDFANQAEDIQDAFRPFFENTITEPSDPNVLYTNRDVLMDFDVIDTGDVDAFAHVLLTVDDTTGNAQLYFHLEPARTRYKKLTGEKQVEFRRALTTFLRHYSFLSQVVPFADLDLERLYAYGRFLARRLPRTTTGRLDLSDEIVLTHLRTELTGKHDLSLTHGQPELPGMTGDGAGPIAEPELDKLSEIIAALNAKFGENLGAADRLYFEQIKEEIVADPKLQKVAQANTRDDFRFDFNRAFITKVVDRRDANEELFRRMMDDEAFAETVMRLMLPDAYDELRAAAAKAAGAQP